MPGDRQSRNVAVIGAGPCGVAAALSLKRLDPALGVSLFHGESRTGNRPGETLPPGAESLLAGLGCIERFHAARFLKSFGTRSAWGAAEPRDNDFVFSARGPGWLLDRARFDEMLRNCARDAGIPMMGRFTSADTADFVIDASGRNASYAVSQGAKRIVDDRLAAVFVTFEFPGRAAPPEAVTLVEAHEHGWWYSCVVPGVPESRLVVAWMSDADLIRAAGLTNGEAWLGHFKNSALIRPNVEHGVPMLPPALFTAQSQYLDKVAGPGWLAAGDAASAFDPLSSQGIAKALRSGKVASFVAYDALNGRTEGQERYRKIGAGEYENYRATRAAFYSRERRWPESPFWKRRAISS